MPDGEAEVVDFKLTRIRSEPSSHVLPPDSSEEEFQSFIRQLSLAPGLDELIQKTATTTSSFRYREYMELSEYLRILNLNFPNITLRHKYWPLTATRFTVYQNTNYKKYWNACTRLSCIISFTLNANMNAWWVQNQLLQLGDMPVMNSVFFFQNQKPLPLPTRSFRRMNIMSVIQLVNHFWDSLSQLRSDCA